MVTWQLHMGKCGDWNDKLMQFPDFTHSQTYDWGEYRKSMGWQPYRWLANDANGKTVVMMQGLLRVYPGKIGLLWVAGGPVGDLSFCDKHLMALMMKEFGVRHLYCRISLSRRYSVNESLVLGQSGWKRAMAPLLSGLSMLYDPSLSDDKRLELCGKNWRRNLRRSANYNLSFYQWKDPDINLMFDTYDAMQGYKKLSQQFSKIELESIFRILRDHIVIYRCDNESGELLAFRGYVYFGDKAWDMFAATSVEGRKVYASYGVFDRLMKHCRGQGICCYDMCGIDPYGNQGVYNFKKGTGADAVEYLGEWDWTSSEWLRWGANLAMSRRRTGG